MSNFASPRIVIIGDGCGILSAILKMHYTDATITNIDIFPALLFQAVTLSLCHPQNNHALSKSADGDTDFTYCMAKDIEHLSESTFDVAINVASMQEMLPEVIEGYFTFLRTHMSEKGILYCCNREEKELVGGEILRLDDYPWSPEDQHLIAGYPNHYTFFFSRSKTKTNAKILGIPVPFCREFDGKMKHKLTVLKKSFKATAS